MLAGQEMPMTYLQRVLQPGEQVRHTANLHWIVYWPGIAFLVLACALLINAQFFATHKQFWHVVGGLIAVVAAALLLWEWFTRWTTEIAVTDRRIIHKEGFIRRDTNEMNLDKVESVQVKQSIPGRILDYGQVTIIGTGEGETELRTIANPIELRNYITGVISRT
jgi:uncharacterized membrane protein YdbT with pleckstrin-like domain